MANYCAVVTCRQAFKVKDPNKFEEQLQHYGLASEKDAPQAELWYDRNGDAFEIYGYSPLSIYDTEHDEELPIEQLIQPHLKEGEVCVLMEVGYTKCRYTEGGAFTLIITPSKVKWLDLYQLTEDAVKSIN